MNPGPIPMPHVDARRISTPGGPTMLHVVRRAGDPVGMVQKYRRAPVPGGDPNPWIAYAGLGTARRPLGAYREHATAVAVVAHRACAVPDCY